MARRKKKTTKTVARDNVTLDSVFTNIANAIRAKTGGSDPISPRNMGNAIRGIKGVTEASLPDANLPAVFTDIANAIRACGITGTMTASQMATKIGDIVADDNNLELVVQTTSYSNKSGIYSAQRDDTTKPIVIDWGDGTVENVNGDVSRKVHTYAAAGTFNVVVENIKSFAASTNDYTWYSNASRNQYTLKEVVAIPYNINLASDAFMGCQSLNAVHVSSLTLWCGITFQNQQSNPVVYGAKLYINDSQITNLTIPSNVTNIGNNAFCGCSSLTNVTIPNSVTSIGDYAFENCNALTSMAIPNSVTSIGDSAFYLCWGITSITIGNNVNSIGSAAFGSCRGISNISIPNSVTNIGGSAFWNMCNLETITFSGKTISQVQSMTNYPFGLGLGDSSFTPYITVVCSDGSFQIQWTVSCLLKGTDILLADNTTKKIENLTYDDTLKVWDFDEGQLGSAKVCWLTRPGLKNDHYYQLTFDDGTVLKTTGVNSNHRIFSVDQSKFTNVCDAKVGDKVFSIDGTLTITDVKYVEEECEYYNVMTSGKINCFANGILTSDRYGNLYPIADMKYVKDGRSIRPYSEYETVGIDRYWYDNLRLGENTETVEKSKEYVWKCLGQMLPIPN